MKFSKSLAVLAAAASLAIAANASAALITHEDLSGSFRTNRSAGADAPVGRLTVNTAQTLTGFGVDVDLNAAGNLNFLIFNSVTGALLYQSGPKAFADTGDGYKFSDAMSFTLLPGVTYGLTAASDVGGTYFVDFTPNTVSDINFLTGNQNLQGTFTNLALLAGQNCCDVGTALEVASASNVPEPATTALITLGLVGLSRTRRRKTL